MARSDGHSFFPWQLRRCFVFIYLTLSQAQEIVLPPNRNNCFLFFIFMGSRVIFQILMSNIQRTTPLHVSTWYEKHTTQNKIDLWPSASVNDPGFKFISSLAMIWPRSEHNLWESSELLLAEIKDLKRFWKVYVWYYSCFGSFGFRFWKYENTRDREGCEFYDWYKQTLWFSRVFSWSWPFPAHGEKARNLSFLGIHNLGKIMKSPGKMKW